jgi:MFS family permease
MKTHDPPARLIRLVMIGVGTMDLVGISIVHVALPAIGRDLAASTTQLPWIASAYMLAFAATLIVAGSLGDTLGRKRVFLVGVAGFGLASLAAGLAQSPGALIAARAAQGGAAAAMIPQLWATFRAMYPGADRGKAFAMYGAILGLASALGLLIGGVLTDLDVSGGSWRSVFLVNVPVALAAFVAALRVVPETRDRRAGRPDVLGAGLLAAAMVAVVYPILEGRSLGWPSWIWAPLPAAAFGIISLGLLEEWRREGGVEPVLPTRLLCVPALCVGLVAQLAFSAALHGFVVVFAVWFQLGSGFSPLATGAAALAFQLGGVGLSLLILPLVNIVRAHVPPDAVAAAGGTFTTAHQLGGALGVAFVGTVFFSRLETQSYSDAFRHALLVVGALVLAAVALSLAVDPLRRRSAG